jgi:hypothetical protein
MKNLLVTLTASILGLSLNINAEVIDMWKCGKPDTSKAGAGFKFVKPVSHELLLKANGATGGYNHHSKLFCWENNFYAMWSNNRYAEDAPGQRVLFSFSKNARNWSDVQELFPSMSIEVPLKYNALGYKGIILTANRWEVWRKRLFARALCTVIFGWTNRARTETVDKYDKEHRYQVMKFYGYLYREVKSNGKLGKIFTFNRKLRNLPEAIYQPADGNKLVPGFRPSPTPRFPHRKSGRRLCEATCYQTAAGKYVVLFRDDDYSHRMHVAYSNDCKSWTVPQPTNIPDSPSESKTLALNNGTVLLAGNNMAEKFDNPNKPRHYGRDPLMIAISPEGQSFMRAYAVRGGKQKYTVPGVLGRGGGAQYPSIVVKNGKVFIMYSMGKEDIWVSSFPLSAIGLSKNLKMTQTQIGF